MKDKDVLPRMFKLINGENIIAFAIETTMENESGWLISNPIEVMLTEKVLDKDTPQAKLAYQYEYSPLNYLPLAKEPTAFLASSKIIITSLANDAASASYRKLFTPVSPIEMPTPEERQLILGAGS
jgi:hypothetical protein